MTSSAGDVFKLTTKLTVTEVSPESPSVTDASATLNDGSLSMIVPVAVAGTGRTALRALVKVNVNVSSTSSRSSSLIVTGIFIIRAVPLAPATQFNVPLAPRYGAT